MNAINTEAKKDEKRQKIVFFIDKEKFTVDVDQLTVRQLIVDFAKENPATTILGFKEGNQTKKFTNLDEVIRLKDGMHFVLFHTEPTPVS
ncbi:MAG TPA: hypothetical protein VFA90_17300 [Terriglobales bacterium]|jgi:hypothetical protein|nr:hypothetical protein [Terriglobales bacterium]